jgi:phosphatidate cytidylyltransferase
MEILNKLKTVPSIKMSKNLQQRIASALVLIPVVLAILWVGGALYNTIAIMIAVIMSFEWSGIITSRSMMDEKKQLTWRVAGIFYVTAFVASLTYLRSLDNGFGIILFLLMLVWATDIAAYFAGRFIGGPKIYVKISPNKTWAGLAGGMIASGLVGAFGSVFMHSLGLFSMFIIGALLAVVSQAGDFLESWIKRQFEVKDSGNLIPGHGGLMDRVDGLTTVAVLFAFIALIKGGSLF